MTKKVCSSDGDHHRGFRNAVSKTDNSFPQVYPHPDDQTKQFKVYLSFGRILMIMPELMHCSTYQ